MKTTTERRTKVGNGTSAGLKGDSCPRLFRPGKYSRVFEILWEYRENGISRIGLLKQVVARGISDARTGAYAVQIVSSPTEDGRFHRSAGEASKSYFVRRDGGLLRLVMRDRDGATH